MPRAGSPRPTSPWPCRCRAGSSPRWSPGRPPLDRRARRHGPRPRGAGARGRLKQNELEGGSFAVSNLGMYGRRRSRRSSTRRTPASSPSVPRRGGRWSRRTGRSRRHGHVGDALGRPSGARRGARGPVVGRVRGPHRESSADPAVNRVGFGRLRFASGPGTGTLGGDVRGDRGPEKGTPVTRIAVIGGTGYAGSHIVTKPSAAATRSSRSPVRCPPSASRERRTSRARSSTSPACSPRSRASTSSSRPSRRAATCWASSAPRSPS